MKNFFIVHFCKSDSYRTENEKLKRNLFTSWLAGRVSTRLILPRPLLASCYILGTKENKKNHILHVYILKNPKVTKDYSITLKMLGQIFKDNKYKCTFGHDENELIAMGRSLDILNSNWNMELCLVNFFLQRTKEVVMLPSFLCGRFTQHGLDLFPLLHSGPRNCRDPLGRTWIFTTKSSFLTDLAILSKNRHPLSDWNIEEDVVDRLSILEDLLKIQSY